MPYVKKFLGITRIPKNVNRNELMTLVGIFRGSKRRGLLVFLQMNNVNNQLEWML
jgi:hypothetical protein